jgi:hypothetical protein
MKANELMIDNLLNKHWFNEGGTYDTPTKVSGNDLKYWDKCGVQKDYTPIPLTEEWLLKFGFKPKMIETEYYSFWKIGHLGARYDKKTHEVEITYIGAFLKHIKNVHQLQNLYFALTGEELTIRNNRLWIG